MEFDKTAIELCERSSHDVTMKNDKSRISALRALQQRSAVHVSNGGYSPVCCLTTKEVRGAHNSIGERTFDKATSLQRQQSKTVVENPKSTTRQLNRDTQARKF